MEVIQSGAQAIVGLAPSRFEPNRGLELFDGLLGITLVMQSESKVVVCQRVAGIEIQSLAVSGDGFVPRFGTSELSGLRR